MTRLYRYVTWPDVARRLSQGWAFAADLGPTHGQYSCLMVWLCCKNAEQA